jgi:hypothetical protein
MQRMERESFGAVRGLMAVVALEAGLVVTAILTWRLVQYVWS